MASNGMSNSKVRTAAKISRRRWLGSTAATLGMTAPLIVPRHVLGGVGHQAPRDTLRIAAAVEHALVRRGKTGQPTTCPIEFACEMTEVALLGAMALRTGRLLQWDAEAMRITNNDQAGTLVDPPYRDGWSL